MTISERISQGLDFFKDVKQTTIDNISETTEKVKNSLAEAGDRALSTTVDRTSQITDNVNDITSKAIENAIDSTIQKWLADHPIFHWLASHPIATLIIVLLFLFVVLGLFEAFTALIKSIWLFIFKIPQKLIKVIADLTIKTFQNIGYQIWPQNGSQNKLELIKSNDRSDRQQRIAQIAVSPEQLKQEQNRLLEEIAEILELEKNPTKQTIQNAPKRWMTSRRAKSHN